MVPLINGTIFGKSVPAVPGTIFGNESGPGRGGRGREEIAIESNCA